MEVTMDKKEKKSLPEPRTYTVEQIAAMLNIGRTTAYQLVKQEEFRIVRIFVLFLFITERGFSCLKHGTARRKKPLKEGRIRLTILLKFWASEELPHISL